ncbi:hypothetical protein L484_016977 [Morus notabilis]|uniref:Uncharacterized protein n=1 Tax=Morus notabilis TaxID=981085 RepID=W9R1S3_9ROSA|nr:hypothetical protein L484_016977 [Morus notabilis]
MIIYIHRRGHRRRRGRRRAPAFSPPSNPDQIFLSSLCHSCRHHRRKPNALRCSVSSFSERHYIGSPKSDDVVELPLFPLLLILFLGEILPL